ncbi:SRPBCC family protein [Planococcus sp. 1R117A]|uniref:SRPBCC family protein n=1 Tax=Planococcus sp. 1R117A TaxID=3447020 RepID=UPI003EDC55ED
MNDETRSVFIEADPETVWMALTNDENFSAWYAPGSVWRIPELEVGCKALFTLMPSEHNQLEEGEHVDMSFTITEVVPHSRFSYTADEDQLHFIFDLRPENAGTRVTVNMDGFQLSLENLKAFAEGRELPNI